MAVGRIACEFVTEKKTLSSISANYLQGDVSKSEYTPVGIISIDGTGIAATNSIRLCYIEGTTARVSFTQTPASGSSVMATILYKHT